jgi:long-chain acyl-CoA synthetase
VSTELADNKNKGDAIVATRYDNLIELVNKSFTEFPDRPAYSCFNHTLSYKELDLKSAQFASFLRNELKLGPGDRLAIQLPNILQYPIAMYGAIRAGIVVVNINPLYTSREIEHQLVDSGAKALLVLANCAHAAAEILQNTDVKHTIVTSIADELPTPKRQLINFVVKHVKKMVPEFTIPSGLDWGDVKNHSLQAFDAPPVEASTLAVLQYTGGTTGVAKGAMLTHQNLASNAWQMVTHMPLAFETDKEVFIACLPLYHIYALNLHGLCAFSQGAHNVLIPNPRDIEQFCKFLKPHKYSVFIGINTLFRALVRSKSFAKLDHSHLKVTSAGGMALTEDAALSWKEATGCKIIEGYGLTETSPVLTGNLANDIRLGSIGVAVPDTEIRILDNDGNELPDGEAGELCARGPQVMAGYWQRPEATAEVMTKDGFFRTGDIAVKNTDGYLKIVDRKKDMILVSGFNVYPNEVEAVLTQHPDILEAAVIGIEDHETGEAVKAFIVAETDELSSSEVISYCRDNLTRYKVPKSIEFRQELPKSAVGKILRKELR